MNELRNIGPGRAIVVMGVSGCGKSSVGAKLALRLGAPFLEGDSLHPSANVEKMAKGIPLTDDDRFPWLERIGEQLAEALARNQSIVLSCSALRKSYRDILRRAGNGRTAFVFLDGTPELLAHRMGAREGHFMPTSLLTSQLQTLENPGGEAGVVTVSIDQDLNAIVADALSGLGEIG
ncbi:gluconokinase [Rhizobium sp. CG5]|uniref:gluconokinase n=1 Tax=Rhizobium sp. CG5 TaxID=2726076 RepID=UPI0020348BDB|nr:gluconokinase [Rhizobium sp. CG5]MCM2472896.1 gluconokinase [Rhizobium sp. CG5]